MSPPPLPAATADRVPAAALAWHSGWLAVGSVLVVVWIGFLAALTWTTANPPVANAVQIASSDLILVGHWKERAAGRFHVERELKSGQLRGEVLIEDVPPFGPPDHAAWVIPVIRRGKKYSVTQGELINRPVNPQAQPNRPPWKVEVPAQCYPATADVLQQIDAVLKQLPAFAQP